jgi:hypothetical protein
MKISSKWTEGVSSGNARITVDGRAFDVLIRIGVDITAVGDLNSANAYGDIHIALVDNPRKAAKQIRDPLTGAEFGDVVVLLCASDEARKAVLDVLGLNDARTVFDTD